MVFGGYDQAKSKRSSSLIAIDVDRHSWWWVRPEGVPVISRFSPTMVAIKNRLYIFGGLQDNVVLKSYSIIEYADGAWRWVERDRHACYSDGSELPSGPFALSASAISLYNGKQILLTPGRADIVSHISLQFLCLNSFYFFNMIGAKHSFLQGKYAFFSQ